MPRRPGSAVDQEDHRFALVGAARGRGERVLGMALLAGRDDLGLRRLALPVGQLLGARIDEQGDRVRALAAAGELGGELAQQRGAALAGLGVDDRLAAGTEGRSSSWARTVLPPLRRKRRRRRRFGLAGSSPRRGGRRRRRLAAAPPARGSLLLGRAARSRGSPPPRGWRSPPPRRSRPPLAPAAAAGWRSLRSPRGTRCAAEDRAAACAAPAGPGAAVEPPASFSISSARGSMR